MLWAVIISDSSQSGNKSIEAFDWRLLQYNGLMNALVCYLLLFLGTTGDISQ